MTGPRRAYVDVDDRQLHYRHSGARDLPVLLLLHQTPSSSAMYDELMRHLSGQFFLLAPDTPGFGNSDPLPEAITVSAWANAISVMLDQLDIEQCAVFGHHTGAAIAVELAHRQPHRVSALALSGPTLLTEEQQRVLPESASPFPPDADGSHLLGMWQRLRGKDSAADLALSQRELLSAFACGDAYQGSYRAVCAQDFAGQLETITCPALVFAGESDPLRGAVAPTAEKLQCAEILDLPAGAGTYICEQQAGFLAGKLSDFFASNRRES